MSTLSKPVWVCYGIGDDSTAMLVEMVRRKERIDLITFANTGGELPRTYAYGRIFNEWLLERNYPGITIVQANTTLEEACLKNETIPSLAFGWHTCSIRFKITPQVKFAKQFALFKDAWAQGLKVDRLIGYDAGVRDKARSARSTTKFPDLDEFDNRFPLQEWGWDRVRCVEEIHKAGLPNPGKSSCYFCPAKKKHEILDMKVHEPEHFNRAIAMEERALRGGKLTTTKGLGRSFAWGSL